MPRIICLLSAGCFLLVAIASPASAARRPSFYLDYSIWKATHIVLATEGDAINGRLTVLASWKGDLAPNTEIALPELAAFADAKSRRVHYSAEMPDLPEPYARVVTGSRIVLFLVASDPANQPASPKSKPRSWSPASYLEQGAFKVSVAWLERGEAYAFVQVVNPGPSVLTHLGTAIDMKARVAALNVIEVNLNEAVNDRDPLRVVQSLRAFKRQGFHHGARASIESLGRMGPAALPTLRQLRSDRTLSDWSPKVIAAMVAAGGLDVAPDLTAAVEEGLIFWQERLPKLEKGWWNNAPDNERRMLRAKYGRLLAALRALVPLRYAPCRNAVLQLRDLWQSDDTLSDVGDSQMARACNAVLKNLSSKSTDP